MTDVPTGIVDASQPANNAPAGGVSFNCSKAISVEALAYSNRAPPTLRVDELCKVPLLQLDERKNQLVCKVEATVCSEMQ